MALPRFAVMDATDFTCPRSVREEVAMMEQPKNLVLQNV
jgi:hypothetical protein